ncbi:MAG: acyl-CoA dehydrogenase family protein [Actinomycetota bacterium]
MVIHPLFTAEHEELRTQVRRFVESELQPHALDWEREGDFPNWVFKRMGDLGLLGLRYPPEHGGQGGDWSHAIVLAEELARIGSGGVGMAIAVQTEMATPPILRFGTEEQKERYLAPAIRGEKIVCLGISEPDAGSDVANIQTTAVRHGDGWAITGRKMFITNGRRADFCLLVARTDRPGGSGGDERAISRPADLPGRRNYEGFSLFLVDTDLPGFHVSRTLDKLGMRSSDTAELVLDDVRVPASALLGEEGKGFPQIMWELQGERLVGAAGSIAGAWAAFELTLAYAKDRQAFGRPIARFQVLRHRFAEMATELEAARQLLYDVALAWERGEYPVKEISMVKLHAGLVVNRVINRCLQIHGGYGYSTELWVERAWRDARLLRIGGGTDEVMREVISKTMEGPRTEPGPPRAGTRFSDLPKRGLFTEDHDALRAGVREFVERRLRPHAEEWERAGDFPVREVFREAGEMGLFGAKYEEAYGGTGPDLVADALITEELVRCGSGGVAAALGAHKDLASYYVYRFGTEEQRRRWLVPSVAGEAIGALAVTEPGAGSDVGAVATRAARDGDHWVLTGTKTFITNGPIADHVVVAARTDPGARDRSRGLSLLVVEPDTPGFTSRRLDTVGWRTSHTGELSFDEVRVPAENLLGQEGRGFVHIMENFQWERVVMALAAVAAADLTLEMAMGYARDRRAFDRPVGRFQVWRHRFADLATEIEAARSLTYHALRKVVAGEDAVREVSMAKWFASELDWRVADEAVQVHGGYGYMMEFPVQRAWRDARLGPIGGGTTEIMKELIGRSYGL